MIRPTLALALNSSIPNTLGVCNDRNAAVAYINSATQRLLSDPLTPDEGWWGGWVTMLFNLVPVNHTATLRTPGDIARIIVLDICKRPRFLRNGFYEYLQFGNGHQPAGCKASCCEAQQVFDRDNVTTLVPFPTDVPQFVRIYPSDASDVGKRVVVQGLDKNGIPVLGIDLATGASSTGETVTLVYPFATTANEFQDITGLIKDPTLGPVKLFTVDPTTHAETALSSMDPNETTASYREYFFNGLPAHCCNTPNGTIQVYAQCRLDFVPAIADTDYLSIPNLLALEEECQALRYSRMDDPAAAQLESKHHGKAIQLLNGQLDLYLGKVRTAVGVPIFGSQPLRRQPV